MDANLLITWLIVGLVAGVLASFVVGSGYGLLGDIAVGIIGAFVGGWLFERLHWHAPLSGIAGTIAIAFVGSIVLLVVLRIVRATIGR